MKIYLAHSHRCRQDGKWIEHAITAWGHQVYNPFDGDQHARELTQAWFKAEQAGDRKKCLRLCKPIYDKDNKAISAVDVVVAYYPSDSTGTAMEIPISRYKHKKTVIVLTDTIHPFTNTIANHVLALTPETPDMLKELLEKISEEK